MTYIQPLVLIVLLACVGGLIRLAGTGKKDILITGVVGLWLISWPPTDWLFSRPLEAGLAVRPFTSSPLPQAIVVLAAAVSPPHFERPYSLPDFETFRRCTHAAWLCQRWPMVPVLVCGGPEGGAGETLASTMRRLLLEKGVPSELIWTEERSRNTYENAIEGAQILQRHGVRRIALVVDASSVPRAAGCFRKLGIEVLPAPSSFREFGSAWEELIPSWRAIQQNENTLHESAGLLWYWMRGRL